MAGGPDGEDQGLRTLVVSFSPPGGGLCHSQVRFGVKQSHRLI